MIFRFSSIFKLIIQLLVLVILSGCSFGASFIILTGSSLTSEQLAVIPNSKILVESSEFIFSAEGGDGNYTYSIISGEGSIDPVTGRYTAPATIAVNPNVVIKATDSSGVGSIDSTTGLYTMPSQSGSAVVEVKDTLQNAVTVNLNVTPTIFNNMVWSVTTDGSALFAAGSFNQINPYIF